MKKRNLNLALIMLGIFILVLAIYLVYIVNYVKLPIVNVNCSSYSPESCPTNCQICPPCEVCSSLSCRSKEFCENLGFDKNFSNQQRKIYCTPEQKKAQVCAQYYSPTCGWFDESINCYKYPCAQTFSNPCEACADKNVEFYTEGNCPN